VLRGQIPPKPCINNLPMSGVLDTHPPEPVNLAEFRIRRKQVLGGLTHEYYIAA